MPKYSKIHEQEFVGKIRQVLVINPNATILGIQKILSNNGIELDKDYINKLLKKIRGERAHRYNNIAKQEAMAKFEDFILYAREKFLKIYQTSNNDMVKTAALNHASNQYKDLLKMQLDVGVFEEKAKDNKKEVDNIAEILKIIDNAEKERVKSKIKPLDIIEN